MTSNPLRRGHCDVLLYCRTFIDVCQLNMKHPTHSAAPLATYKGPDILWYYPRASLVEPIHLFSRLDAGELCTTVRHWAATYMYMYFPESSSFRVLFQHIHALSPSSPVANRTPSRLEPRSTRTDQHGPFGAVTSTSECNA